MMLFPEYGMAWRRVGRALLVLPCLLAIAGQGAFFDFSTTTQHVLASYDNGSVTMSVFDVTTGTQAIRAVPSSATFDLATSGGTVAWSGGSTVHYYTHVPGGGWVGESVALGPTSSLTTQGGIIAWGTSSGAVYYRVYDRLRGQWMGGIAATASTANLGTVDGIVAWSTGGGAYARTYDPIAGQWRAKDLAPLMVGSLHNTNGVVAVGTSAGVSCHVYDPTRTGWMSTTVNTGAGFDLVCRDGVVAWSASSMLYSSIYDPSRGQWVTASAGGGFFAGLSISNATVIWDTGAGTAQRGYSPASGSWGSAASTPLARFAVAGANANAPALFLFIDLSIGGTAWSWNFGDGSTSTARSPSRRFTTFGTFLVTETVSNPVGSSSTNHLVITDVSAPTGSVVINGGDALTTNSTVTLRLTATDNSGSVTRMRFSNDGMTWSALEAFATNKLWVLSASNGLKTVSVQFADAATNLSAAVTDTIQLDTSPLPVLSVIDVSVGEGAGGVAVHVVLSHAFTRLVSVFYTASNGTATAGSDYGVVNGRLDFPPGNTDQSFNLPITQDALVELNETIHIHLGAPTNGILSLPGTVTILDDDLPTVSFASTNFFVSEALSNGVVSVRLNAPSGKTVVVGWSATNGTANAGADFVATNGVLAISSGETETFFQVPILNDALDEFNETIQLRFTSVTNAILSPPTNALLTIVDDDAPRVGFSAANYPVFEHEGFVLANVWLSKPVALQVEFDYRVLGGSAAPSSDYEPAIAHRVFSPGMTNIEILVIIRDDTVTEPDETVLLSITNLVNAGAWTNLTANAVIYDDDRGPRLTAPQRDMNGLFHATVRGKPGQRFTVEFSSNLSAWAPLLTLTNTTGTLDFSDTNAPAAAVRFYRTSTLTP